MATRMDFDGLDAIVKDLNDYESTIFMVDSNIHREKLLPGEKSIYL